jgi:hypothetical protein
MADAELQLITGHSRRETLAIYQEVVPYGPLSCGWMEFVLSQKEANLP